MIEIILILIAGLVAPFIMRCVVKPRLRVIDFAAWVLTALCCVVLTAVAEAITVDYRVWQHPLRWLVAAVLAHFVATGVYQIAFAHKNPFKGEL